MMLPRPNMRPTYENALTRFCGVVISAMHVLTMPTLPLRRPLAERSAMAQKMFGAKPNATVVTSVPKTPMSRMTRRPMRSLSQPKRNELKNWQMLKLALSQPAHVPTPSVLLAAPMSTIM